MKKENYFKAKILVWRMKITLRIIYLRKLIEYIHFKSMKNTSCSRTRSTLNKLKKIFLKFSVLASKYCTLMLEFTHAKNHLVMRVEHTQYIYN